MKNYDITVAANVLEKRVGFRDTIAKKEYLALDSELIADPTNAELYVNSVAEYWLRVEQMSNSLEFAEGYDVDVYDNTEDYDAGKLIKKIIDDREYVWVAKIANGPATTVKDPETSPDAWESYLSYRLKQYRQSVSREIIASAISGLVEESFSKELKKSTTFYIENTSPQPTQLRSRFVGVEIAVDDNCELNRILVSGKIGLYITGAQADVNIYFYHSSKNTPLETYTIPSADIVLDQFKWYDLKINNQELVADLYDDELQQGGRFYIGFYEDELAANMQGYNHYEAISGYSKSTSGFRLTGIEILPQLLNGTNLPTLGEYYDSVNWNDELPINLRYEVSESYYPLIKENIHIFDNLYRCKLAYHILFDMMQSSRINNMDDNADAKIDEVLHGDPENENNQGLKKKISMYWKKLMADMKSLFTNNEGPYQGAI